MSCRNLLPVLALLALGCRHSDHGSAVESAASTQVERGSSPAGEPLKGAVQPTACVVPMSEAAPATAAKADECPLAQSPSITLPVGQVTFDEAPGRPRATVEFALNNSTRQRGLMFRTRMEADRGMLFAWEDEEPRSFWMHNTCIPLDMLFITKAGTIAGVLEQVPVLNDEPRGVPCPVAHVLEMNAGWSRAHGVKPGQHVTIAFP